MITNAPILILGLLSIISLIAARVPKSRFLPASVVTKTCVGGAFALGVSSVWFPVCLLRFLLFTPWIQSTSPFSALAVSPFTLFAPEALLLGILAVNELRFLRGTYDLKPEFRRTFLSLIHI